MGKIYEYALLSQERLFSQGGYETYLLEWQHGVLEDSGLQEIIP